MPSKNGLWLNDQQGIFPVLHCTGEQDEEGSIASSEARPFDGPVEDAHLVPEQQVLRDQLWLAAGEVSDGPKHKAVSVGLGQARDSGAEGSQPLFDHQRNTLQNSDHLLPPYGRQLIRAVLK